MGSQARGKSSRGCFEGSKLRLDAGRVVEKLVCVMYIPKTALVVLALLMAAWFIANSANSSLDTGTVTSWDGRQIQGQVTGFYDWGIDFQRKDGVTVQVPFKTMSERDAEKFRRAAQVKKEAGEAGVAEMGSRGDGEKEGWFWRWLQVK
jgi:hypothetical protein